MDSGMSLGRMSLKGMDARVVVAVDFGTTFSGFAYAHQDSPTEVHKLYEWDGAAEANAVFYCKTQTSLYYTALPNGGGLQLQQWGWSAFATYNNVCKERAKQLAGKHQASTGTTSTSRSTTSSNSDEDQKLGHFVTWFKLHLAGATNVGQSAGGLSAPDLPRGLTVDTAITDYLTSLSTFVIQLLQHKYGPQLTATEVQWCLTVPAIWDDIAKQKMKVYAEKAGMVQGRWTPKGVRASPHKLLICLEPEAAALYCLSHCEEIQLTQGDQYLVADIGGGTVDIVVHEWTGSSTTSHGRPSYREVQVKEAVPSYGALCGGSYVDKKFDEFLNKTIGCYPEFASSPNNTNLVLEVKRKWEMGKRSYNGHLRSPFSFQLSSRLADAWEKWDKAAGHGSEPRENYDELELTDRDMKHIFDPVVDEIIELIAKELIPRINTIMLVGGFSSSPYLKDRVTRAFPGRVIINPPDAGAAVCHGAVLMGLAPEAAIVSRIARKTYGVETTRDFRKGDPPEKKIVVDGVKKCDDVFEVYAEKGAVLSVNETVCHNFCPLYSGQREIEFKIFSSPVLQNPGYTSDRGVVLDGTFSMDISDGLELGKKRSIEVTMMFGRSSIEVQGRRLNFGNTTVVETFWLAIDD